MKRTVVQTAVAETIRSALPKGFTLWGGRYLKYYKAHVRAKAPPDYQGPTIKGYLIIAKIIIRDNQVTTKLWTDRTPRNKELKKTFSINLEEPDSLDRLEKWAKLLHLAKLPWSNHELQ